MHQDDEFEGTCANVALESAVKVLDLATAVICLNGALSKSHQDLEAIIRRRGGSVVATVTRACTHLISTPKESDVLPIKVIQQLCSIFCIVAALIFHNFAFISGGSGAF